MNDKGRYHSLSSSPVSEKEQFLLYMLKSGAIIGAMAFFLLAEHCMASGGQKTAEALAGYVLDGKDQALQTKQDLSDEALEARLGQLFGNPSKEADEAVVILMSCYLGEHNGEELNENLLARGPRMIPLVRNYLINEPAVFLTRYKYSAARLPRSTTALFLREDLEILKFQSGARRISSVSVTTAPLREQTGQCKLTLGKEPPLKFGDNLAQTGESYQGSPAFRIKIEPNGEITHVESLQGSGIKRLDAQLKSAVPELKYAARPGCGAIEANVVFTLEWASTTAQQ